MKFRTLLLTSALLLTFVGTAVAQTPEPTQPTPAASTASAASTSDMSVSGKVVSYSNTELVIDSDAGQRMTFVLDPENRPASTFTVGERVSVKYRTLSGGTAYQAASVVYEPTPKALPPATVEAQAKLDPQTTGYSESSTGSRLPDTASSLPWIGLLGLLALGGAVVVRSARS